MSRWISAIAVIALGISAGAMLAEGAVLVPYWRSLPTADFLRWFSDNEPRLVAFYGPLEMAAAAFTVMASALYAFRRRPGAGLLAVSALLVVGVLALYPIYFRAVNASFVAGTIDGAGVAAELARWSVWQWLRVAMGVGALIAAVAAVLDG
ncbi:MAG: DUF1772 domain-containing protein [Deltaproteobacteria bacterium]|nr:DUF1772 domain-containing protein [Deltaproteobacteria bacterium]